MTDSAATVEATAAPAAITGGRWAYWRSGVVIALVGLVMDQLTKVWAKAALSEPQLYMTPAGLALRDRIVEIIPGFFQLRYATNDGAAFSILSGKVGMLTVISLVASIAVIWFWQSLKPEEWWGRAASALILSGAVGNLIDRAFRGSVIDFLDVYIVMGGRSYHWPTFNIADSCICVGAAVLAWRMLRGKI